MSPVRAPRPTSPGESLEWTKKSDGSLSLSVTIPANATAQVAVPAASPEAVTGGSGPAAEAEGVRFVRMDGDRAVFEVGSGTYHFATTS